MMNVLVFLLVHDDLKVVTVRQRNIDTEAALKVRLWYRQKIANTGAYQRQITDVEANGSSQ